MTEESFNVVFKGEITDGQKLNNVKNNLAKIFKKDRQIIEKFFSGRIVKIKINVNKTTALKYKAAMQKAGAVCHIVPASPQKTVTEKPLPTARKIEKQKQGVDKPSDPPSSRESTMHQRKPASKSKLPINLRRIVTIALLACFTIMILVYFAVRLRLFSTPDEAEFKQVVINASTVTNQNNPLSGFKGDIYILSKKAVELVNLNDYSDLERYIFDLIERKPYNRNGRRVLEELYQEMAQEHGIGASLTKWCDQNTFHGAFIVRGLHYIRLAWEKRGGNFAHVVSEEGLHGFRDYLHKAASDFKRAAEMNPDDPCAAASMVEVCKGLGIENKAMEEWFQKAVTADPCAFRAYINKFEYLTPKWHGTRRQLSQFSKQCYENSPESSRIYTMMFNYILEITRFNKKTSEKSWTDPKMQALLTDLFSRWEKDFPQSDERLRSMGYYKKESGNIPEALKYFGQALELDPNDYGTLLWRGVLYSEKLRQWENARKDFLKILERYPRDYFVLAHLGQTWLNSREDCITAIKYYNQAIQLNPNDWISFYNRARSRDDCGLKAEAIADLNQVLRLNKNDEDTYFYRGQLLSDLKKYKAAIQDYNSAIALNPQSAGNYFYRGRCYMELNRLKVAEADFKKSEKLDPKKFARGVSTYLKTIEKKRNTDNSSQKSVAKSDSKNRIQASSGSKTAGGQADSQISAVSDRLPSDADMMRSKAMISWKKGLHKKAAEDFKKLLLLEPNDPTALYHLGVNASRWNKDDEQAHKYADKLLQTDPDSAPGYRLRGMIFARQKKINRAIADYRKSLELAPHDPERAEALRYLAREMMRLKKNHLTMKYYSQLIDLEPRDSSHRHFRGMVFRQMKAYKKAIADFTESILLTESMHKNTRRKSGDYLWRGYCYRDLGMTDKAIEDFRKAYMTNSTRQGAERALAALGVE